MRIVGLAILAACTAAAQTTRAAPTLEILEVRYDAFIDMHFFVRAALENAPADAPEELQAAIAAARRVERELGAQRGWALIESSIANATNAELGVHVCTRMPETIRTVDHRVYPLREPALALAKAYVPLEPWYREHVWPAHRRRIAAAYARLQTRLGPHESTCFQAIAEHLRLEAPGERGVRVLLTATAPQPGAVTRRRRGGGGVCYIAVDHFPGDELPAAVLREAIRALDFASNTQPTALNLLRARLQAVGLGAPSRAYRYAPQALAAVEADALVAKFLAPGFRRRVSPGDALDALIPILESPWNDYLAAPERVDLSAALHRIADGLKRRTTTQPAAGSTQPATPTDEDSP